jgi:hypothetical protein
MFGCPELVEVCKIPECPELVEAEMFGCPERVEVQILGCPEVVEVHNALVVRTGGGAKSQFWLWKAGLRPSPLCLSLLICLTL